MSTRGRTSAGLTGLGMSLLAACGTPTNEQTPRVTSAAMACEDTVEIGDPSQLEAFAELECGHVKALRITGLKDLSALSELTSVDQLTIASDELGSLAGLEHLTRVDTLDIAGGKLANLSGLSGLTQLNTLHIADANELHDLSGLSAALTHIAQVRLERVPELRALTGLEHVASMDVFALDGAANLRDVQGLSGLRNVVSLSLQGATGLRTLTGLEQLVSADWLSLIGRADASGVPGKLEDLSALAHATLGDVEIRGQAKLSSLAGLPARWHSLVVADLPALRTADIDLPLAQKRTLGVSLHDNPALERVNLSAQGTPQDGVLLTLADNATLRGIVLPETLAHAQLDVAACPKLSDLSLPKADDLRLAIDGHVDSLNALLAHERVAELTLSNMPELADLSFLRHLSRAGTLELRGVGMQNLEGLAGLRAVEQLTLSENPALEHVAALGHLRQIDQLSIHDNPKLDACDVELLTNTLHQAGALRNPAEIARNHAGQCTAATASGAP